MPARQQSCQAYRGEEQWCGPGRSEMQPQCYKTKFLSVNTLTHTQSGYVWRVERGATNVFWGVACHTHTHTRRGRCRPTAVTQIHLYLCPQGEGGLDWDCCKCPCWPCLPVDLASALVLVLSLVLRALLRQI